MRIEANSEERYAISLNVIEESGIESIDVNIDKRCQHLEYSFQWHRNPNAFWLWLMDGIDIVVSIGTDHRLLCLLSEPFKAEWNRTPHLNMNYLYNVWEDRQHINYFLHNTENQILLSKTMKVNPFMSILCLRFELAFKFIDSIDGIDGCGEWCATMTAKGRAICY